MPTTLKTTRFTLCSVIMMGAINTAGCGAFSDFPATVQTTHPARPTTNANRNSVPPQGSYTDISDVLRARNGVEKSPAIPVLGAAEEQELLDAVSALPEFPVYPFSGCHDRAHALWRLLPERLKGLTEKVWLFAPGATTLAFGDSITTPSLGAASPNWKYHVALTYRSAIGRRVLDPTAPGWKHSPPTETDWLARFAIPAHTLGGALAPSKYLFYAIKADGVGPSTNALGSVMNTGEFFECVGLCRDEGNIENALARDAVGAAIISGDNSCPELSTVAEKPDELLTKLKQDLGPGCADLTSTFQRARESWRQRLWQ